MLYQNHNCCHSKLVYIAFMRVDYFKKDNTVDSTGSRVLLSFKRAVRFDTCTIAARLFTCRSSCTCLLWFYVFMFHLPLPCQAIRRTDLSEKLPIQHGAFMLFYSSFLPEHTVGTQLCNFPCQRIESTEYTAMDLVENAFKRNREILLYL